MLSTKTRVIIDTDPGIDDAIALGFALAAKALDIKLITTVSGNVGIENVTNNALKLLKFWNQHVPVARGAAEPLLRKPMDASDVHAFAAPDSPRPLMVACLEWPGERPLEGHSDADVAAHALCDAMLLATGLGELGTVFGVDRPEWAGASGRALLEEVRRMTAEAGWVLGNATVQVVGNRPRMAARLPEACAVMSEIAGGTVTVSATTSDHLGFTGRGEGVAALASVLMVRAE